MRIINSDYFSCHLFLSSLFLISSAYVNISYPAGQPNSQSFQLWWIQVVWETCSLHWTSLYKENPRQDKTRHVCLSNCYCSSSWLCYPLMAYEDFYRTTWGGFYDASLWLITCSWRDVRLSETDNVDFYLSAFLCKTCHQSTVSRP